MKLLFLGSGTSHGVPVIGCECPVCTSADPRNRRTRASVLVRGGEAALLIDTPPDFREQMLRHRIRQVDAILFTHGHADHIFGLDDVRIMCNWRKAPMPVYGSAETLAQIRRKFDYIFETKDFSRGWDVPRLTVHPLDGPQQIAGVEVIPVPIRHGCATILGYRIGGLAYLTDCSGVPDETMPLLLGLDTVVVGAIRHERHPTHFSLGEALALVERLKARRAYITHISHRLEHVATEANLPAHVRLAYDGLEVEFPGCDNGDGESS